MVKKLKAIFELKAIAKEIKISYPRSKFNQKAYLKYCTTALAQADK